MEGWRRTFSAGSVPPVHCPPTPSTAPLYRYAVLVFRRESTSWQVPKDGEETTIPHSDMSFTVVHFRDY